MKATENELYKIKDEYRDGFKNKVYRVYPRAHYDGRAFVYAENVQDANNQIQCFRDEDKNNKMDSFGYSDVDESCFTGKFTDEPRQIIGSIYYTG